MEEADVRSFLIKEEQGVAVPELEQEARFQGLLFRKETRNQDTTQQDAMFGWTLRCLRLLMVC